MLKGAEVVRNHDSCVMNAPKMENDVPRTKNLGNVSSSESNQVMVIIHLEELAVPESNCHIIWSVFQ